MDGYNRQQRFFVQENRQAREATLDDVTELGLVNEDGTYGKDVFPPGLPEYVHEPPEQPEPTLEQRIEWFWNARGELAHIAQWSDWKTAARWGVLGAVMARVLAAVEPTLVLPGEQFGSPGSLNTCIALVGESGSGKDTSFAIAQQAVHLVDRNGMEILTDIEKPGSGEGLSDMFCKIVQPPPRRRGQPRQEDGLPPEENEPRQVQYRTRVLGMMGEIDTLSALLARRGSTLLAELKTAYTGGTLGHFYRDAAKRVKVESHRYRLSMLIGVQPGKGQALLADADGGTPQRFLWMPVQDRSVPHPDDVRIDEIYPEEVVVPSFPERTAFRVDPVILREIREIRYRAASMAEGRDPLAGHRAFSRLKVAAFLALICSDRDFGRKTTVTLEDWELAGVVMDVSDRCRQTVVDTMSDAERARGTAAALESARQSELVEDRRFERVVGVAQSRVVKVLVGGGGVLTSREVRARLSRAQREVFGEVVDRLVSGGRVVLGVEVRGGRECEVLRLGG